MPGYVRSSMYKEADKRASQLVTQRIHNEFSDDFTGIGSFEGTFGFEVMKGSQSCQAPPQRIAYVFQEILKEC